MLQKWFNFKAWKDQNKRPKAPDYAECKRILLEDGPAQKAALAQSEGVPPEILYFLSSDADSRVRCAVARNPETPIQADVILSKDKEVQVRLALSAKVSQLLPDLRPEQNEKVAAMAFDILRTLAADQEKEVRLALANAVNSVTTVPKSIVMTLAQDSDDAVASSVLEYSHLLDDNDLMGLIVGGLQQARLGALARRADLSGSLTEAISATRDAVAISNLLKNETAHISEQAFDMLMEGYDDPPKWLELLASRDAVPESTLWKLARMASGALLKKLQARGDLGAALKIEIDQKVASDIAAPAESEPQTPEEALAARVAEMHRNGTLTEKAVMDAVKKGENDFVAAAMAQIAGVPTAEVKKVFAMNSAKSVLALAWKCEFGIKSAVALQKDVAKIPTSKCLGAATDSGYPLTEDELLWQADLLFTS